VDALSISAASGMKARMESLEMLANNIANHSTAGYKSDREFYSLYVSPAALEAAQATAVPTTVPVIERHWTDFSQGRMRSTGSALDLALEGKGFFTVQGPQGPLYTRNGSFRLSPAGELQTLEGYALLDRDRNRPIRLEVNKPIQVDRTGTIFQDGAQVARLLLTDFRQPEALAKRAGAYFQLADTNVAPQPAAGVTLHQGSIEEPNFSPAEAAVRLVSIMRQFETLQKAMMIGGEMNRRAVEEVARVGS